MKLKLQKRRSNFLLFFLVLCLFVTGCSKVNNDTVTDSKKFEIEYESLNNTIREKDGKTIRSIDIPSDNPIVYSSLEEIVEKIDKKETFVVYFGFSDCPWCRSVITTLIDASKDLGLNKIYYVDIKDVRDVLSYTDKIEVVKYGDSKYYELLAKIGNVLDDYTLKDSLGNTIDTNEKRIYAPNVVSIVSGVAMEKTSGISDLQTDAYMTLTDEMINETYYKFKCALKCVVENATTCSKSC